ncbi:hypothetical protein HHK36_015488 [Tetracentron sinense]|uniref:ABC transporter domain-containing protein n=1 Tax=Tetracentron sinense TaxID=13715 RepID=A0A835DGT2_TETSI|nr:hypothetical protein HHK36_015488 [Tetracentron sinense]
MDDVSFAYPSRPNHMVLKGITLKLRPDSKVALVGPSGGGKISLVSQEPVLFNCSVEDNIAYGFDLKASSTDIENAAKMANAHEFISKFPGKYQAIVGESGVRLSGGQKQRIAIARALLISPSVLLLDEATSALDAESEYLVQDAMDSLMKVRTVLVVAHRLSTVKSASTVAVISDGQIVESGTHEELLSKDGIYTALLIKRYQDLSLLNQRELNPVDKPLIGMTISLSGRLSRTPGDWKKEIEKHGGKSYGVSVDKIFAVELSACPSYDEIKKPPNKVLL